MGRSEPISMGWLAAFEGPWLDAKAEHRLGDARRFPREYRATVFAWNGSCVTPRNEGETMTVGDLVEHLQRHPSSMRVVVDDNANGYNDPTVLIVSVLLDVGAPDAPARHLPVEETAADVGTRAFCIRGRTTST